MSLQKKSTVLIFITLICSLIFLLNNNELINPDYSTTENIQEKRKPPTQEELDKKNEVIALRKTKRNKKSTSQSVLKNIQELTNNGYEKKATEVHSQNYFGGMVKNMVIDRLNPDRLVLATETSGAWVGIKDGTGEINWQTIDDDHAETAWESIAQHPTNPNIFFFGSRYDGLHYADLNANSGLIEFVGTIEELNGGVVGPAQNISFAQVNVMKSDPLDPGHIYIAGGTKTYINSLGNIASYNNVYRFDGNTATIATQDMWINNSDGGDKSRFGDIEILSPETFIASHKKRNIRFSTDPTLYYVWNEPSGNPYIELTKITNPQNPKEHIIYSQHLKTSSSRRIYQSVDEGSTWTNVSSAALLNNQHSWLLDVVPFNNGQHVLLTGSVHLEGLVFNTNFAQNEIVQQTLLTEGAHDDYHAAEQSGDDIYVLSDGGIHHVAKSALELHTQNNTTIEFSSLNRNFSGSIQVNNVGFSELAEHFTCGIWHSGSGISDNASESLEQFSFGDGFGTCFLPRTVNRFYTTQQSGKVFRSTYDAVNDRYNRTQMCFQNFSSNKASGFETDIFTHPLLPGKLFGVGKTGLHRCNNASTLSNTNIHDFTWVEPYTVNHDIYTNGIYDASFSDWDTKFYYGLTNNENGSRNNPATEIKFYRIDNVNAGSMNPALLSNLTISNGGQAMTAVDICKHVDLPTGTFYAGIHKEGLGLGIYKIQNAHESGSATIELIGNSSDLDGLTPLEIMVSPFNENVIIVGTYYGLFSSVDGGNTYTPVLDIPAVRIKDLKYKASENTLYIGTYGRGVWKAFINNEIVDCDYISEVNHSFSEGEDLTIEDNNNINPFIFFTDQSNPGDHIKNIELSFYLRLNGINSHGAKLFLTAPDGTTSEYDFLDMIDIPNPFPNAPWISLRKLNIDIAQTNGDMSDWELRFEAPTGLQFDVAHTILNYTSIQLDENGDCDGDGLSNGEELALNRNPEDFSDFGFELNGNNEHWIRAGNVYKTIMRSWGVDVFQRGNNAYLTSHAFNFHSDQLDGLKIRLKSQINGTVKIYVQNHTNGDKILVASKVYNGNNSWVNFNIYFNPAIWDNLYTNSLSIEFPDAGNAYKRTLINYIRPILPDNDSNFVIYEDDSKQDLLELDIVDVKNESDIEHFRSDELIVYPNPTSNIVQLKSPEYHFDGVYDLSGRKLNNVNIDANRKDMINVSALASGIYMVAAKNNSNQRKFVKFVKQ